MILVRMLSMVMFQGGDVPSSDGIHWLVIFVGVIAFCSFVQFLVFVGAAVGALKAYKSVSAEMAILKGKALPIVASVQGVIDDSRPAVKRVTAKVQEIVEDATPKVKVITTKVQEIIEDATPKVKVVTSNVADISDVVKTKVHDFEATLDKANQTLQDANSKTRAQVDRVDGMVASALKATSDMGNTIHRGIRMPVMEVAGVINGLKAGIDVLSGRAGSPGSKGSSSKDAFRGGSSGAGRHEGGSGRANQPVPVSAGVEPANPSSAVAPSPGAEEVVERFRSEKVKTIS
jgi:hypothetical protein